ncbi:putative chitooligosaccharide deacetylase [Naviculisporaceae sp. PSN 640]
MFRLRRIFRLPSRHLRLRARRLRMAILLLALLLIPLLLIFPLYVVYKPPSLLIRHFAHKWTDVLFRLWLPSSKKIVALTIDDAPSDHTRDILHILSSHDAHATFFVIGGQVPGREDILREIIRAGHELGNHGMHDEPARSLSDEELKAQILQVQAMINKAYEAENMTAPSSDRAASTTLAKQKYFRPGSGFFSDRMRNLLQKMDYHLVLGSIYPHDAQISWDWLNARHVLSMLHPGGIIICHDRRSWTVPMLRRVLPEMKMRGYKAVSVTELLAEATG